MTAEPLSPYALQKLAGELYCRLYTSLYGLETVALRYFNIFGPRQDPKSEYAAVIPRFICAALAGEGATIFGDGEQTRDFVFVQDAVRANLLAADAERASGAVINVATGRRISLERPLAGDPRDHGRHGPVAPRPGAGGRRARQRRRPLPRARAARIRAGGRPARGSASHGRELQPEGFRGGLSP